MNRIIRQLKEQGLSFEKKGETYYVKHSKGIFTFGEVNKSGETAKRILESISRKISKLK